MYQWFLIAFFICVATFEKATLTFDPQKSILAECIQHHLVRIDVHYESTQTAADIADLAAKRFHGKSMVEYVFNARLTSFFCDLRSNRIFHGFSKDQLSERLRRALKQALMICGNINRLSSTNTTILDKKKTKETRLKNQELISFSTNEFLLSECIENHLKLTGRPEFVLENEFTEAIADLVARRHSGKVSSMINFHRRNKNLFYDLRTKTISHNFSIDKLSSGLELLVMQAVEDCGMDKFSLVPVPIFETEPTGISQLLNLVLVKWPTDLYRMIQSSNGRAVLRRYAYDAWTALIRELKVCKNNPQIFRLTLRSFWKNRAKEMFDAYSAELPYIVHSYTLNYPTPHMVLSDFDKFTYRNSQDFNDRNLFVPRAYADKILNIHKTDLPKSKSKVNIYDDYFNDGMTYAEYYLENQINQFYRIIFFFLELRAIGISTDNDDVYNGPLLYYWVPKQIQAIIYDDYAYRNYLLDERLFYKMILGNNNTNEIAQSLIENSRVLEENLILLRSNIASTSAYKFSDESLSTTIVETTKKSMKRKDDVWKNENGKCFPCKRNKMTSFFNSNGSTNENLSTKDSNQVTNLSLCENHNYFTNDSIPGVPTMGSEISTSQEQGKIVNNDLFGYIEFNEAVLK